MRTTSNVLAVAVLAALSSSATAQCPLPDGLNGPCCTLVSAKLPPFPPINVRGLGLCWKQCTLGSTECLQILSSPPTPTACGRYAAQMTILDCSGLPLLSGFPPTLDYARTWKETSPAGVDFQVWRFVAKVDLGGSTVAPPGCPAPPCLSVHPPARCSSTAT